MVQDVYNLERILESIKGFASSDSFRITLHGQYEMAEENIKLDEVQEAIATGEIIENYPEHQRGPCCLLNGITKSGRSLHIICTTTQPILIIITVYIPKPPKWITPTKRRRKQ